MEREPKAGGTSNMHVREQRLVKTGGGRWRDRGWEHGTASSPARDGDTPRLPESERACELSPGCRAGTMTQRVCSEVNSLAKYGSALLHLAIHAAKGRRLCLLCRMARSLAEEVIPHSPDPSPAPGPVGGTWLCTLRVTCKFLHHTAAVPTSLYVV